MISDRPYYILDADGEPEHVGDALVWAVWFESADRVVLQSHVDRRLRVTESPLRWRTRVGVGVSTVFLGLDHNFTRIFGGGPPVLWETMVFGGPLDGESRRYASKLAALEGHADMVARVLAVGRRLPRKLKIAIAKRKAYTRRLTPRETRRVERFERRVAV